MAKVGIIVLNWNGKEDTTKCLQSLQNLTYSGTEIIIVDNGSTDGSQDHFQTHFPHFTLLETGENLGYAGGNNVGLTYALKRPFEYFFILNNDTIVDPGIIEAFLDGFKQFPNAGILGSKIYLMNEPGRLDHFGGNWNAKRLEFNYVGYRELDDQQTWEQPQELDYVCGAGIMIRRAVFETIGLFDPRFFLFWEETDFCFRARRAGFGVMTQPKAIIWHKVSASFKGGKPLATYFYWRNRLLWIERNVSGSRRIYYLSKLIGKNFFRFYLARRNNAALLGINDYLMRRFGQGRSKKFQKNS